MSCWETLGRWRVPSTQTLLQTKYPPSWQWRAPMAAVSSTGQHALSHQNYSGMDWDPYGPGGCKAGSRWAGLVPACPKETWSDLDLEHLETRLMLFITFLGPLLSSFFGVAEHVLSCSAGGLCHQGVLGWVVQDKWLSKECQDPKFPSSTVMKWSIDSYSLHLLVLLMLWLIGVYTHTNRKYLGSLKQVVSPVVRRMGSANKRNFHIGIVGGII